MNKVFRCAMTCLFLEMVCLVLFGSIYFLSEPEKSRTNLVFALCSGSENQAENYRLYLESIQGDDNQPM